MRTSSASRGAINALNTVFLLQEEINNCTLLKARTFFFLLTLTMLSRRIVCTTSSLEQPRIELGTIQALWHHCFARLPLPATYTIAGMRRRPSRKRFHPCCLRTVLPLTQDSGLVRPFRKYTSSGLISMRNAYLKSIIIRPGFQYASVSGIFVVQNIEHQLKGS
jgi:hypothetical protein